MVNSSILLLAAMASGATAFSTVPSTPAVHSSSTALQASRRDFFTRTAGIAVATTAATLLGPAASYAAAGDPPTKEEIERIKIGYENIQYLLDNWEKETTVCRENGGECKRDANAVRRYLGLRSTTDPLFQIEKVFAKVRFMDDIDPEKLDAFFEATEDWNSAMSMSNSMAFISQFGEYNPGGGKDEVLKYLNEAQKQVVLAEKSLKVILDCVTSTA
mmetsp:Transcript_17812/g.37555  ORF Transcript_17812/g.37555 Transcript_17812/m.37555 type:complete len:217 (+) Transcript_17812:205-855(+)|eukprot:CAMPEP_0183742754 /NCGR_PEP_ID=MMETSP0737-20130205/64863_1 /TAXON_ID=385413 /ORGANISM="Thalassiosira miniscula, Strain CCMP1093" /LENGTH=216 /DNA_ID=CAMNT_0025978347 /DNA_START=113 /DNA_END=763 /DNA_ORIENTATION=-